MNEKDVFAIGLMSGTSLDGIDLVYVLFQENNYNNYKIIYSETISYNSYWKDNLRNAIDFPSEKLKLLDFEYGKFLGETVNAFIKKFSIRNIDFIASHGHTVLHEPHKGITLQIGKGQEIAAITGVKVICDFRTQDVALGGQGAPLVPVGDELLFSEYDYCLNLGGFSNISFKKDGKRIAFDICPVNIVLNHYVNKLGFDFDDGGKIASKGKLNLQVLEELNSLNFYTKEPPKSLGLEWVQQEIFPRIDNYNLDVSSVLRTFTEHIAIQIAGVLKNNSLLVTGGGAFNTFLISRIEEIIDAKILIPEKKLIDFKEALIFAFLGYLRLNNKVNCLKFVTGAERDHCSGKIFNP